MNFNPQGQHGQMNQSKDEAHLRKTRAPVKRPTAETNILISLTSFGLTVAATRVFLQLTGFPQVGGSVLHIAHAIWGGLLSFTAVNLLHFYVNQFGALAAFFANFALFLLLLAYRSWYLTPQRNST